MTIAEILTGEKDNTEYKVDIPSKSENYMRTVVAYANANGGRLVFGVENNTWKVTLSARNRSYDTEKTSRELTTDEIQAFCNRLYQHARELCVNEEAKSAIRQISISQLLSFRLVHEENGRYYAANGYQLLDGRLEDYPDAAIQCAVFKGTTRNIFITRKEFSGYIDEQVESAYAFVLEHINLGARIDGLARQDIYELPIRTIREMITNAVCHRSYLCPGKVQVALFDDRLEVTSPGMLDKDLTIEKMKAGISKIRNTAIARVFAYMNMIEAWGTDIPKIFQEAKDYGLREPELLDMGSDFRINLYRGTPMVDRYGVINPKSLTRQADD